METAKYPVIILSLDRNKPSTAISHLYTVLQRITRWIWANRFRGKMKYDNKTGVFEP